MKTAAMIGLMCAGGGVTRYYFSAWFGVVSGRSLA